MSRLSDDPDVIQAARASIVDAGIAKGIVSAAAALTSATGGVAFTYTTDDPGITADRAVTIADGDAVTAPENIEYAEEINSEISALNVDLAALRVAIEGLRTGSRFDVSPVSTTAVGEPVVTYTTDDPSITANQSITIADGDLTTAAETHEAFVEIGTEVGLVIDDMLLLAKQVNLAITKGWNSTSALAARTSNVAGVAIVWTTDDPSITAGAASTIADGDTLTAAENGELIVELEDQLDKCGDDYLALRTTFEAIQNLAI